MNLPNGKFWRGRTARPSSKGAAADRSFPPDPAALMFPRMAALLGSLALGGCSDGELSDGCALTMSEFEAVRTNDAFTTVASRFELCRAFRLFERSAEGTRVEIWEWRDKADNRVTITVTFDNAKVASKAQTGLR